MSQRRSAWIAFAFGLVAAAASAQELPPLPPLPPVTSSARTTLEQLARSAAPARTALPTPPAAAAPAPATAPAPPARALLELLGTPDNPRARIAIDGIVYTVSAARPELGAGPCILAGIDVESRSVVLRCDSQSRPLRIGLGQRPGGQDRPSGR
jgi:hypothetical protein